jgi:hypothetical protein
MAKSKTTLLIDDGVMSGSFTTDLIDCTEADAAFIQIKVTGASSLDGTLSIEGSAFPGDSSTWQALPGTTATITDDGLITFDLTKTAAPLLRVRWVRVAGTAVTKIVAVVKIKS